MYTHCPNCDTHFEITQEYLDIANGMVRCGKCDHVFNALDSLYDKQSQEPETPAEASIDTLDPLQESHSQNTSQSHTASAGSTDEPTDNTITNQFTVNKDKSKFDDIDSSFPSINVKEKMERIAASLSAATQELKNARESTVFSQPAKDSGTTESSPDFTEKFSKSLATDSLATDSLVEDELLIANESPVENESLPEDELLVADESLAEDELLTVDESMVTDSSTGKESGNELDLVDFDYKDDSDDNYFSPLKDVNIRQVEQDDIDILNSLMEEPEQKTADSELLDELDDLNKTLSDKNTSLDDEFSNRKEDFGELKSGTDFLAELEQLEGNFLNNKSVAKGSSLDESLSEFDDLLDNDELFDGEEPLANKEPLADEAPSTSDQPLAGEEPATETSTNGKDEEVVPSFLTQSDATASSARAMFGWLTGTIVLLLILAAQYLHVNSTKLSQNPTFRPLLESLCPMTGCSLPLLKAPRQIVTVSHDVRSHSNVKNALEIQLTFKNKTSFTQAYPTLEIIFSNHLGDVIARRKFSPKEYLTGNIHYTRGLKSNQSQDVKLEIVDPNPGSPLLSFQFNYL